jgi:hypothetical protein
MSDSEATGISTPAETSAKVQQTRSRTGLMAVVAGDVAIALAAIIAILVLQTGKGSSSAMVSILTSAFTAIGTMTTAYFGIKASSNTAQDNINLGSTTTTTSDGGAASPS